MTALVVSPLAVALAVIAFPLSAILFGSEYRQSAGLALTLLAPAIGFMLLQTVNAVVLFTSDRMGSIVAPSLAHVAVNIALTWWLVGEFGGQARLVRH